MSIWWFIWCFIYVAFLATVASFVVVVRAVVRWDLEHGEPSRDP